MRRPAAAQQTPVCEGAHTIWDMKAGKLILRHMRRPSWAALVFHGPLACRSR